jgi:hypothetical protein
MDLRERYLQYALLPLPLPALAKGLAVFGGTVLASWAASAVLRRLPAMRQVI